MTQVEGDDGDEAAERPYAYQQVFGRETPKRLEAVERPEAQGGDVSLCAYCDNLVNTDG